MAYFQKEKNGTITVKFYDNTGEKRIQRAIRGNKTKRDANNAYIKFMSEQEEKAKDLLTKKERTQADTITVGTCFDDYELYIYDTLKSSSAKSATDVLKLYILPTFKDRIIADITTADIMNWKKDINAKNFRWKYKSKIYCAFTALINYSRKMYGVKENVVSIVRNFKNMDERKEMLFWTESEFTKFISVVDSFMYRTFFSFLYLSGCRKGEALALNWEDVDFENKIVHIRKTLNRKGMINGSKYEVTLPKTVASVRDIMLPDTLVAILTDFKLKCEQVDGFMPKCFIFGISKPLVEQTIRRTMDKYADKAGVKHIRVHDLRHSHASLLINQGADITVVSQRLGHSDISETLNTYTHMYPNKQKTLMGLLNIQVNQGVSYDKKIESPKFTLSCSDVVE